VNFDVIRDMILGAGDSTVKVYTGEKIKRKRNGGVTVAIVTEPEDKMYISSNRSALAHIIKKDRFKMASGF